jgi:F-type H+-transporting ATPase subunit b
LEALGINLGYLFVQIFNFLIVFFVLRAWVFIPIMGLLEKRRTAIAQGLEDARVAAEARANAEKEARDVLAKAQSDAAQRVRDATERADTASRDVMAKAEQDAAKIRSDAVAEAEQERDQLLSEVRNQVALLAISATQKLVNTELSDQTRQHELIEEFFSGVESGKVTVLEGKSLQGASAEITSAVPLTDDEKYTIRQEILAKTGSQTVTFRVDPEIMGGLVIKVGDKVVDGSVAGQLESLRQTVR